ncbi:hypothetical protein ACQR13_14980 [Bradyrhizobium sp. HKCCYLRH3059]|uniref:hypothetical protein n=1 Tax=Bradyrhizobium sp. HKCCYLRH3059 TaxID=3420745 RepID=UPI003EBC866D
MPEKAAGSLWNLEADIIKISRALFSPHVEHLFWKPAINDMLDYISSTPTGAASADVVNIDSETFIKEVRGRSSQLYSTLSKGVHWEFFSSALVFGESTVKEGIRDTFLLLGLLGLASHFIPTAYARLQPAQALEAYEAFRRIVP